MRVCQSANPLYVPGSIEFEVIKDHSLIVTSPQLCLETWIHLHSMHSEDLPHADVQTLLPRDLPHRNGCLATYRTQHRLDMTDVWTYVSVLVLILPDTPWDCHICRSIGVVLGVNVGIYGSPMECLDTHYLHPARGRCSSPVLFTDPTSEPKCRCVSSESPPLIGRTV